MGKRVKLSSIEQKENGVQFKMQVSAGIYQVRTEHWVQLITIYNN